jgi:hypothetical protein
MLRQTFIAALSLVLCATAVRAEEVPMALRASSGPIGTSVARVRFVTQSEAGAGVQELVDLMLADRSIGVSRRADLQS